MEGFVLGCLDFKEILGVAQVKFQIRRYLIKIFENARESALVGSQNRIVRVHYIEGDRAIVHIDDGFHGVSDVIQAVTKGIVFMIRIGIRKVVRCRVGVLYPIQLSFAEDRVGISIQFQEGCNLGDAILNVPIKLNPAFRLQIRSQENIDISLGPGKEQAFPEAVQRHAAAALVAGVYILITLWIIELFHTGCDNAGGAGHRLSVIDTWLTDIQSVGRLGRNIIN